MKQSRVKAAILGTGFMGRVHLEAISRLGFIEVCGIASSDADRARRLGAEYGLDEIETDYRRILGDPEIQVVHICTPTAVHAQNAKEALIAGKHVLSEKPLATAVAAARELVDLAEEKGLRNCTNHNLRYYPLVQHMRGLRETGELGEILVVQGTYSQDYLLFDTDWNWRLDAKESGPSCAMADIGSHWCDMAEHVTGLRINRLCADLHTFHKTRKRPKFTVETFAGKALTPDDYEEIAVDNEDFGAVLLHIGERARGSFTAGEVMAGRKNRLYIEIFGTKGSVAWDQERPEELWLGSRNSNNQTLLKDASLLTPGARGYTDLPGGHGEGYDDTFKNVFRRFYRAVQDPSVAPDYPQFSDGLRQLTIIEAELASNRNQAWVEVPGTP
jgi:predicted dehydrogenase